MDNENYISYEEFSTRASNGWPAWNNYPVYFTTYRRGMARRKSKFFKRLQQIRGELEKKLTKNVMNVYLPDVDLAQAVKPFERDLFEAYIFMRRCGASDKDLFS